MNYQSLGNIFVVRQFVYETSPALLSLEAIGKHTHTEHTVNFWNEVLIPSKLLLILTYTVPWEVHFTGRDK